jgi:phage-related protein
MSEAIESMVKMLAQLPEQQQREMIKTRLATFAEMRDEERVSSMKAMAAALQKLDQGSQRKLTYARLEALAENFDAGTRKKLMGTHMQALMGLPKEQMMADVGTMVSAMSQCHEACRMKNMGTMKELMSEMPPEKRGMMMQMLPPDVQKMLMG